MRGIFGFAALAGTVLAGPAAAQFHGGTPMQVAAAAYGQCFYERGRSAARGGASADAAIAAGFASCKSQRKRALKETRARIAAAGLPDAKSSAETLIASGDRSLADTLRQEIAAKRGTAATAPK